MVTACCMRGVVMNYTLHVPQFEVWSEAVHVYVAILFQFQGKLGGQRGVEVRREVAQGIPQCQLHGDRGRGVRTPQCPLNLRNL